MIEKLLVTPALLILSLPVLAFGRPGILDRYVVTSWTYESGLPTSWVSAVTQDRQGYLWLGTKDGLIRFDGLRFSRVEFADEPPLPDRSIVSLCAARDGGLWIGYAVRGVSRLGPDGRLQHFGQREGFSGRRVRGLLEDQRGTIWAATRSGLFRFVNEQWTKVDSPQGVADGPVYTVYEDSVGHLWIGTANGVFRRDNGQDRFQLVDASIQHFPSFNESPSGTMWVTDPEVGIRKLVDKDRPKANSDTAGIGVALLRERRGSLWLATYGQGLWLVRQDNQAVPTTERMTTQDGLLSDTVLSLFEDVESNVWVGTQAGLHKFTPRRVTPVTDVGLVRAVVAALDGDVWVATANGLLRFSSGERRLYGERDGLPSSSARALHIDRSGILWVATDRGLSRFVNGRFSSLPLIGRRWPSRIMAIATDLGGNIWICDQDYGLFRWKDAVLTTIDPSPEVSHSIIDNVVTDRAGRVWLIVAGGGIGILDPAGTFSEVRRSDALNLTDLAVYEDASGAMWFGGGSRLTRFHNGNLVAVDRWKGFPSGFPGIILAIADDQAGNLWVGTTAGIVRLPRGEFEEAAADPDQQLEFTLYDSSDGLADLPVQIGYRNAARNIDGMLWFVTGRGLTQVDPQRMASTNKTQPGVRIERVVADGRALSGVESFVVPPRTTTLQIDYIATSFLSPASVQFRYRLEGFDGTWIDAGNQRQATYGTLPPRRYRFLVDARHKEGSWSEQGAVLDLVIQPAFYQTGWFYTACGSMVVLTVWAGWQLRVRQIRHHFAAVLAERVRLGREIHDTLLQSLVGVALRLDAASRSLDSSSVSTKEQFESIRMQVEQYIREARQSVWDLRSPTLERGDLVTALQASGERGVEGTPATFDFVVSGTPLPLPIKTQEQLLRIEQEAISNAVRHAHALKIRTELEFGVDFVRLQVRDDGCGFDDSDHANQNGKHCGLLIMQERAELVGGLFRLTTGPGLGTDVEVLVPILSGDEGHLNVQPSHSNIVRR